MTFDTRAVVRPRFKASHQLCITCLSLLIHSLYLSWGLSYNMYADKLLQANVFPQSVYDMRKDLVIDETFDVAC